MTSFVFYQIDEYTQVVVYLPVWDTSKGYSWSR